MPAQSSKPHLLLLISEDWYFWTHRLSLARAARDAGFQVSLATRVSDSARQIEHEGIRLHPLSLPRGLSHPVREIQAIRQVAHLYKQELPDIVHHVALKNVLYGSLAARLARVPAVVNAFAGLGHLFTDCGWKSKLLRYPARIVLQRSLNLPNTSTILQTDQDRQELMRHGIIDPENSVVIRGCGADIHRFHPRPEPAGEPIVLLASRMLWSKGIGYFVDAAKMLKTHGVTARFVLVGRVDRANPGSIAEIQLRKWHDAGIVEWWGHRDDMPGALQSAALVVLPTHYGEGIPKILIEAAACGKPIVATDAAGCRDIVKHDQTGLLVPPRNAQSLADAIAHLLGDAILRARMGAKGRELVLEEFTEEKVAEQTLAVYRELISEPTFSEQKQAA